MNSFSNHFFIFGDLDVFSLHWRALQQFSVTQNRIDFLFSSPSFFSLEWYFEASQHLSNAFISGCCSPHHCVAVEDKIFRSLMYCEVRRVSPFYKLTLVFTVISVGLFIH